MQRKSSTVVGNNPYINDQVSCFSLFIRAAWCTASTTSTTERRIKKRNIELDLLLPQGKEEIIALTQSPFSLVTIEMILNV
jgi:hypothetical protein